VIMASGFIGRATEPAVVVIDELPWLVEEKRVLAADSPLSTQPGKPALYRIAGCAGGGRDRGRIDLVWVPATSSPRGWDESAGRAGTC
jgi:hypothetical protein